MDLDSAIETLKDSRKEIDRHVRRDVPIGREVTWKKGPFKGRKGVIRDVYWEVDLDGVFKVSILVATYRKKAWNCWGREPGGGKFVDENTSFNRTYREMLEWFEDL